MYALVDCCFKKINPVSKEPKAFVLNILMNKRFTIPIDRNPIKFIYLPSSYIHDTNEVIAEFYSRGPTAVTSDYVIYYKHYWLIFQDTKK
jgi:hypothetical protein